MALRRWRLFLALAALFLSARCVHTCGHRTDDAAYKAFAKPEPIEGFKVWKRGTGPAVIIFHEVPGLTDDTFRLGREISDQGFTVYIPLLFGRPRQFKPVWEIVHQCVFGEFDCRDPVSSGPIARKLLSLVKEIDNRHDHKGVAAVGMCLTGDLPLELIGLGAPIRAAMLSQPTLPFGSRSSLAVPREAIAIAKSNGVRFVAARFKRDKKSPHERIQRLKEDLGDQLIAFELDSKNAHAHAVLTSCLDVEEGTRNVLNAMIRAFRNEQP